ncbi:MAG TPA: acyl carrier protein [Jatrophihabitans sp.]|nr:acyl carrier protein [Jatrophihabitans sp.]
MTDGPGAVPVDLTGPATDVLRAVWGGVLGHESIESEVGFFDLGATSVDVLRVVETLRYRWPQLRAVDVFLYPTVSTLAAFLEDQPTD